jgi:hypothetical protein
VGPAVTISEKEESSIVWGLAVSLSGFGGSESHQPMHSGIEKLETPTSGKTAVTGITVIWARSLARRASA